MSERTEGWDPMCRYSYRSGACANRHVESLECVGEENCEHSGGNVLTRTGHPASSDGCGLDRWLGLYCERHGRFFCPGREGCATPETYMKNLEARNAALRLGPREE